MVAHKWLTEVDLVCGQSAGVLEGSAKHSGENNEHKRHTGPHATDPLGAYSLVRRKTNMVSIRQCVRAVLQRISSAWREMTESYPEEAISKLKVV